MHSDNGQDLITEITQVWSSLGEKRPTAIRAIPELHDLLTEKLPEENVILYLVALIVQGEFKCSSLAENNSSTSIGENCNNVQSECN